MMNTEVEYHMSKHTRREFLKTASCSTVGALTFPMIVPSSVFGKPGVPGPNERIQCALIGCGGHGAVWPGVSPLHQIVACVDPVRERRDKYIAEKAPGARSVNDFREVIDDPAIDAVLVETPDHWHVPISLRAARAGSRLLSSTAYRRPEFDNPLKDRRMIRP
jgi:hypothetical protein